MSKKLRNTPIYIAPDIIGWVDDNSSPHVVDEREDRVLDPLDIDDKIHIYSRQVNDWFLTQASKLTKHKNKHKGFIVLMICLSYIEGVEQYRRGVNGQGNSRRFFVASMQRLYPGQFNENQLSDFYREARCGLFHSGMVAGRIIINNNFNESLSFSGPDIQVSPTKFLRDIQNDFDTYIHELQTNQQLRQNFNQMYSNI